MEVSSASQVVLCIYIFLKILFTFLQIFLKILFSCVYTQGRDGERGRDTWMASRSPPTGGQDCSPGVCSDLNGPVNFLLCRVTPNHLGQACLQTSVGSFKCMYFLPVGRGRDCWGLFKLRSAVRCQQSKDRARKPRLLSNGQIWGSKGLPPG